MCVCSQTQTLYSRSRHARRMEHSRQHRGVFASVNMPGKGTPGVAKSAQPQGGILRIRRMGLTAKVKLLLTAQRTWTVMSGMLTLTTARSTRRPRNLGRRIQRATRGMRAPTSKGDDVPLTPPRQKARESAKDTAALRPSWEARGSIKEEACGEETHVSAVAPRALPITLLSSSFLQLPLLLHAPPLPSSHSFWLGV